MKKVIEDPNVKAVVIISVKLGSFIAGVDITMLDAAETEEEVNIVLIPLSSLIHVCVFIFIFYCFFAVTRNLKEWAINDTENGGMYMNYYIGV